MENIGIGCIVDGVIVSRHATVAEMNVALYDLISQGFKVSLIYCEM